MTYVTYTAVSNLISTNQLQCSEERRLETLFENKSKALMCLDSGITL